MDKGLHRTVVTLRCGQLLRVRNGVGKCLVVLGGSVWVTQQGDARDIVLAPREGFAFDRNGLAIVEAVRASKLLLFERVTARLASPRDMMARTARI